MCVVSHRVFKNEFFVKFRIFLHRKIFNLGSIL